MNTQLPIIYSRTTNGSIQQWQIIVENDSFYTIEGIMNGKLTQSTPTVCVGKNLGKANETSAHEQAVKEAKSKWQKKIDSGYCESIKDIDVEKFTEPMLAKTYEDEFNGKFPVYSNYKLDGMRCVVRNDGMWSRNGKKILSAPHIRKAIQPIFDKNPNAVFDGELYTHRLANDFNKIMSLVKKTKPTTQDLLESESTVEYWIYDYISEGRLPYSKRFDRIVEDIKGLHKSLIIVDAPKVTSQDQLDKLYHQYMEDGYEGQIIRLDAPYEHKRSKYLLKRKEFKDSEYKILDIIEGDGNRSGTAGYMILENTDGRTFKSNIKGDFGYLKELLLDKSNLIGKLATVKYFCLTPDGVPRFPYVIAIRDYE